MNIDFSNNFAFSCLVHSGRLIESSFPDFQSSPTSCVTDSYYVIQSTVNTLPQFS